MAICPECGKTFPGRDLEKITEPPGGCRGDKAMIWDRVRRCCCKDRCAEAFFRANYTGK